MEEKTIFVCRNCGAESPKWSGRCFVCGAWNTLVQAPTIKSTKTQRTPPTPEKLSDIKEEGAERISVFSREFDRVLGGGLVLGSLLLVGGEPGIGKSTLLLQTASSLAKSARGPVLYISGEESTQQIKMRASRLKVETEKILLLTETNIDLIIAAISKLTEAGSPCLVIVDSIQTMYDENFPSTPGSLVQVKECALKLQMLAKSKHLPIILVGHVTKEGAVAGPKTLEHLVDVVLYLEGERYQNLRILHGVKNRFGPTEEVGVFEMTEEGLKEIDNPSKAFLEERLEAPGSAIAPILSGSRTFLVEIQSLLSKTVFGYPKRIVSGFDLKRLDLLLAVLQKRMRLPLAAYDVYLNVVGGMTVLDRAADLAVCASIFSVFRNKLIRSKTVLLGEVGLSGEIRPVSQLNKRLKEAKALGFEHYLGPQTKRLEVALQEALED